MLELQCAELLKYILFRLRQVCSVPAGMVPAGIVKARKHLFSTIDALDERKSYLQPYIPSIAGGRGERSSAWL